jgi:hypothetical protein
MDPILVGPPVGKLVYEPWVAMEIENNRLVGSEHAFPIPVCI